jgi:hypothetical protein
MHYWHREKKTMNLTILPQTGKNMLKILVKEKKTQKNQTKHMKSHKHEQQKNRKKRES